MLPLNYRTILKVALPMMGASFVQSIVLLTDSAFLSRYSTDAFAAVGNAGLIYITMHMFIVGLSDGSQILISRRIGEKKQHDIGRILLSTLITLCVLVLLLLGLSHLLLDVLLDTFVKHDHIADLQFQYLSYRVYGLLFAMIALPLQAYYFAFGKSWVPLLASIFTAVGNVFLDYGLIFGKLGMPAMGIEGAALASTLSDGLSALFLVSFFLISKEYRQFDMFKKMKSTVASYFKLLKLSFPIVLQGVVGLSTWTVFFIWLEQMGTFELTVSQNIRSVYFLAFVPVWGFNAATKTYISQYFGANRLEDIKKIQWRILSLSLLFMFVAFHGSIFYPEFIIKWINPDEQFLQKSADTLQFVSISMFIFAFISVFFQTINGIGKTHITFLIEVLSVGVYIICAYTFIKVWKLDVQYIWSVEYVYFCTIGLLSIAYLRFSNWKKVKH